MSQCARPFISIAVTLAAVCVLLTVVSAESTGVAPLKSPRSLSGAGAEAGATPETYLLAHVHGGTPSFATTFARAMVVRKATEGRRPAVAHVFNSAVAEADGVRLESTAPARDGFESLRNAAVLALDTRRLAEAEGLFARAEALAPERAGEISLDRAWVYVEEAYDCLRSRDYGNSDRLFTRAIDICPSIKPDISAQWAFARLEVFWSRFDAAREEDAKGDWPALTRYAAETLALGWYPHECHYALGLAYEFSGDDSNAAVHYRAAIGAGAGSGNAASLKDAAYAASTAEPRRCARPVHPLLRRFDEGDFAELRSGRLVIHHHNVELAQRAARALEYYMSLDVLDGFLPRNAELSCDCDVTIYRSHEEFLDATGEPESAMGCFRAATSDGKATMLEIHVYGGVPSMLATTLRHELGHVRLAMIPGFHMGLPQWIQEGVASAAERPERGEGYRRALSEALSTGALAPLAKVLNADHLIVEDSDSLAYAESLACVEALVRRGGKDRFTKFIEVTGARGPDEGLAKVYNMTTADLEMLMRDEIKSYGAGRRAGNSQGGA